MSCVNTDFGTISDVIVQTVLVAKGLRTRTTNTFSCNATDMSLLGGLSLIACLAPMILTFKVLALVTCVICYCSDSTCTSAVSF